MASLLADAEALQSLLIAVATGQSGDTDPDADYKRLRSKLRSEPIAAGNLPAFVRTCRDLNQFWAFIKAKFGTYAERRKFLYEELSPLLSAIEDYEAAPLDFSLSAALTSYDVPHVQAAWQKALERSVADPEGAITAARALVESVCKHVLDESGAAYDEAADLPKLYRGASERLNLAPSQHTEAAFKQILGGCTAVVEGLGTLRNRLGDAHGRRRVGVRPHARHAQLAVNLAGAVALYLLATFEATQNAPERA